MSLLPPLQFSTRLSDSPVCCGWGTDRHWLLCPELMLGGATCRRAPMEVQLLAPAGGCRSCSWHTHFPSSTTDWQPCSCWLFLLSPVILTYQWSNLLFLLHLSMCLVDSQPFKLTLQSLQITISVLI